ncbi:MAG: hypothetical protein EON98_13995 [Chitinophagaceae bacterium]|nr:MAG: hypothetical protein EON98_13995 [Chitinophagaceae bacterium]
MAQDFTFYRKELSMGNNTDPKRNVPAEEGRRNDPNIRDEDARVGNVNTMSSGENDEANQNLTRTTSDNFREDGQGDEKADKRFDEI